MLRFKVIGSLFQKSTPWKPILKNSLFRVREREHANIGSSVKIILKNLVFLLLMQLLATVVVVIQIGDVANVVIVVIAVAVTCLLTSDDNGDDGDNHDDYYDLSDDDDDGDFSSGSRKMAYIYSVLAFLYSTV